MSIGKGFGQYIRDDLNKNDEWYTLNGQKLLQKPAVKGLYIKNGKKVVVNNK